MLSWKRHKVWGGIIALGLCGLALDSLRQSKSIESPLAEETAKLFEYAALIGIGVAFSGILFKEEILPTVRENLRRVEGRAVGYFRAELESLRVTVTQAIAGKPLIFQVAGKEQPPTTLFVNEITAKRVPELSIAQEAVLAGKYREAADLLHTLVRDKPQYERDLLNILVVVTDPREWKEALELAKRVGEPRHLTRLAFNYWTIGDFATSISILEEELNQVETGDSYDEEALARLWNSLAYYDADLGRKENGARALQLSTKAVETRKRLGLRDNEVGSALATLGYVNIRFGGDEGEIRGGITLCEDGRRMGSREDLYFKHLAVARERLQTLKNLASGGTHTPNTSS